jgi:hypothetical protein
MLLKGKKGPKSEIKGLKSFVLLVLQFKYHETHTNKAKKAKILASNNSWE